MRHLYLSTKPLDERAKSKYLLSDELLMENAANALCGLIGSLTHKGSVVTIVCGSGDNGADGYTLARKLQGSYITRIYEAKEPKSRLCKLQSERAQVAGVEWIKKLLPCDVIVDCLFGSGFAGELGAEFIKLLEQMNTCARLKIACDVPSGLDLQGRVESYAFSADYTLSMGALKVALFSDVAKDLTGKVLVGDLGVSRELFEVQSPFYLLEESDLCLPHRTKHNCHKGSFGHIAVIAGEKAGAAELSAMGGLRMGAGLVSVVSRDWALLKKHRLTPTASLVLGSHSADFGDFRATADHQSSSALKSPKNYESNTANPRILEESQAESENLPQSCREQTALESTFENTPTTAQNMDSSTAQNLNNSAQDSRILELQIGVFQGEQGDKTSGLSPQLAEEIHDFSPKAESTKKARSTLPQQSELMYPRAIPPTANVLCLGMGLGSGYGYLLEPSFIGERLCVLDADVFYESTLPNLLESTFAHNLVLTPHPKEFHALLHLCGLFSGDIAEVANNRFELALRFSQAYKSPTLLLKGASPIIAHNAKLYINPLGTPALAKGGSGDVLSGVIAAYLAQGFSPLQSAINASLAHALAATKEKNTYALTPLRLIEHLGTL